MKVSQKPLKNAVIDNAFKDLGNPPKLEDKEYDKIIELYKKMKDAQPIKFDERTDLIIAKIPDQLKVRELKNKSGETSYSVSIITPDEKFWSIIVDEQEKNDFESYLGCRVAIVGKLVEKEGEGEYEGKVLRNVKKYRGAMVLESSDAAKDDLNV